MIEQPEDRRAINSPESEMSMRWLIAVVVILVVVLAAGYLAGGFVVYRNLADVAHSCDKHQPNTPAKFSDISGWPPMDYAPWFMPDFTPVRFPSRQAGLEIAGWYVESDPAAPVVIMVDGIGGCKNAQAVLVPAGMLWHNGFNVLLIDLRDTGDSEFEDGYSAVGNEEYQDVLGAWDWLQAQKGFSPERIGLYANSLGAATALIAFDQEPRVAALFVNSPFSNLLQAMRDELQRVGYPGFLAPAAIMAARLVSGDDLLAFDPSDGVRHAGNRPVFVVHSRADKRVSEQHSERLKAIAADAGVNATFWILDDNTDHVRAPATHTAEFAEKLSGFFRAALGGTQ
jgi:uncharacterized protein